MTRRRNLWWIFCKFYLHPERRFLLKLDQWLLRTLRKAPVRFNLFKEAILEIVYLRVRKIKYNYMKLIKQGKNRLLVQNILHEAFCTSRHDSIATSIWEFLTRIELSLDLERLHAAQGRSLIDKTRRVSVSRFITGLLFTYVRLLLRLVHR